MKYFVRTICGHIKRVSAKVELKSFRYNITGQCCDQHSFRNCRHNTVDVINVDDRCETLADKIFRNSF